MTLAAEKTDEKITILTDVPVNSSEDALHFGRYSDKISEIIMNSEPRFAVGIFGSWGTGKTSLMKMIEAKLEEKYKDYVLGVWFEAWRYDRDKYLALIPFLRQLSIKLENQSSSNNKWNFLQPKNKWRIIKKGVERTLRALSESADLSLGYRSVASVGVNLKNFRDSLQSDGSTKFDGETIQFHEHPTDHLKSAINKVRKSGNGSERTRIVIFIDDLDRCTPDKALEVLESIKAFLDIDGIVYVIAMDSKSIDSIVGKKFGGDSTVKGIDYLQKIVQLPFQVPTWKEGWEIKDIEDSIKSIISSELERYDRVNELKENVNFIVKAVQLNPREVKRFINNIILAESVFSSDQKLTIKNLICVQALSFRNDWRDFLDSISNDDTSRKIFFTHYRIFNNKLQKGEITVPTIEEITSNKSDTRVNLRNQISAVYDEWFHENPSDSLLSQPKNKILNEIEPIYVEYIKQGANLKKFLDAGADNILLEIDKMGKYRMALEVTKHKIDTESQTLRIESKRKSVLLLLLESIVGLINDLNKIKSAPLNAMLEMLYQSVTSSIKEIDSDPKNNLYRISSLREQLVNIGAHIKADSSRNDLVQKIDEILREVEKQEGDLRYQIRGSSRPWEIES